MIDLSDRAAYQRAHARLRARRGAAWTKRCHDCAGWAAEWSYNHGSIDELSCQATGMLFSFDACSYVPRCTGCHRYVDGCRAAGMVPGKRTYGLDCRASVAATEICLGQYPTHCCASAAGHDGLCSCVCGTQWANAGPTD